MSKIQIEMVPGTIYKKPCFTDLSFGECFTFENKENVYMKVNLEPMYEGGAMLMLNNGRLYTPVECPILRLNTYLTAKEEK